MDAGLHFRGQLSSYPRQLALQMGFNAAMAPTANWTQPYILDPGVGSTTAGIPAGNTAGVLYWNGTTITVVGVTPTAQVPALAAFSALPLPYNNLGVPGATTKDVSDALDATSSESPGNSFFNLILRNPTFGNVSMLGQCVARGPTLVTAWIGCNDILGGAMSGNPAVGVNVTPPSLFAQRYAALMNDLIEGVAARTGRVPVIVAANIPGITSIPYFVRRTQFEAAAGAYGVTLSYDEADVALVLFPAVSLLAPGATLNLAGSFTLTGDEVETVALTVEAYNEAIHDYCDPLGIRIADVHALCAQLATPPGLSGMTATHFVFLVQQLGPANWQQAAAMTAFSLDGIHPNNRGLALIANALLEQINAAAGTALPPVDVMSQTWDPTYGRPPTLPLAAEHGAPVVPLVTPEAAAAMGAIFR
jgi:lysophospholipase L1-like esterase